MPGLTATPQKTSSTPSSVAVLRTRSCGPTETPPEVTSTSASRPRSSAARCASSLVGDDGKLLDVRACGASAPPRSCADSTRRSVPDRGASPARAARSRREHGDARTHGAVDRARRQPRRARRSAPGRAARPASTTVSPSRTSPPRGRMCCPARSRVLGSRPDRLLSTRARRARLRRRPRARRHPSRSQPPCPREVRPARACPPRPERRRGSAARSVARPARANPSIAELGERRKVDRATGRLRRARVLRLARARRPRTRAGVRVRGRARAHPRCVRSSAIARSRPNPRRWGGRGRRLRLRRLLFGRRRVTGAAFGS